MIRIMTDSAADITAREAREMGVEVVPLNIRFPDLAYDAEKDEDFSEFYRLLAAARQLPKTSQPSPEAFERVYKKARDEGDSVLGIMISGGLSGTLDSARAAQAAGRYDNVHLVDSRCAILPQRILVEHAASLRDADRPFGEIVRRVEALRDRVRVYGMLETLTYLYKGGRLSRTVAIAGNLLRIKPIITAAEGLIKLAGMGRSFSALLAKLLEAPGFDPSYPVYFGYTSVDGACRKMMQQALAQFPISRAGIFPIGGLVGAHVGPGGYAVAFVANG